MPEPIDCLIVGAGPAGLTAATYLARFRRSVTVIHDNASRAALIPFSHNYPGAASSGIAGPRILQQLAAQARHYGAKIVSGHVDRLTRQDAVFSAHFGARALHARKALLATGVVDIEPALPQVEQAIRRGYVRHCPICDAYEIIDHNVALIGSGAHAFNEALFLRHYTPRVTVLTHKGDTELTPAQRQTLAAQGVAIIDEPIAAVFIEGDKIAALRLHSGKEHRFDTLYSALGATIRSELALALGAAHNRDGALTVDAHQQTSIAGLYAAGDVVQSLNQIAVAFGQAAIAATHIHNRLRQEQ